MIELYDHTTIDQLDWPLTEDGQQAKKYFLPLIKNGPDFYIENVKTKLLMLKTEDLVLPLTVNSGEYENSYVCSPYTQYISCAKEELHLINSRPGRFVLNSFLSSLGQMLKFGCINRTVIVNNWLLSTNLYPEITPEQLELITQYLIKRFPDHFIVWRSLNMSMHTPLIDAMNAMGYRQIAGRQVYLLDPKNPETFKKRNVKHDLKLLKEAELTLNDNQQLSHEELAIQYDHLYIQKYNKFSPSFKPSYFAMTEQGFLDYRILHVNGLSRGFFGYFVRNGVMTCPVLGYCPELNIEENLYRKLTISITLEAARKNIILHKSSGVGDFKRSRGGEPHIEYNLFYGKHLSPFRRFALGVLYHITTRIGIPMLKKYG